MSDKPTPVLQSVGFALKPDGSIVGLTIQATSGESFRVNMDITQLNDLVLKLCALAVQAEARGAQPPFQPETIPVVDAAGLGIDRGRSPAEAILSVRTGVVVQSFALQLEALKGAAEWLLPRVMTGQPGPSSLQ